MWNVDNNSFENFEVSFYDTEILQFVWLDSRIVHKQVHNFTRIEGDEMKLSRVMLE